MTRGSRAWGIAAALACLAVLSLPAPAQAGFHGRNGILMGAAGPPPSLGHEIDSVYPDGQLPQRIWQSPLVSDNYLWVQADPQFSPAGAYVAFTRDEKRPGAPPTIVVMRWNGTQVHDLHIVGGPVTWTPSGQLVFARYDSTTDRAQIWTSHRDGGALRRLFTLPVQDVGRMVESPDGRWIAMLTVLPGGDQAQIWLVHPDGSDFHALPGDGLLPFEFDWLPDSSRIIFTEENRTYPFTWYIKTMNPAGRDVRRLAEGVGPAVSPDGSRIAFLGDQGPEIMRLDGSHAVPLPVDPYFHMQDGLLAWQPIRATASSQLHISSQLVSRGFQLNVRITVAPLTEPDQRFTVTLYQHTPGGWVTVYTRTAVSHQLAAKTWFPAPRPAHRDRCMLRVHFFGSPSSRPATAFHAATC